MNTRKITVNVFIPFFLLLQTLCNAQEPMLFYTCKGSNVVLDLGVCPITGSTFSWSAGGVEISKLLNPAVKPLKTTSYLFKCTHPTGTIVTKTAKVVVIEEVKLDGDLSDRLEGSTLPFKAEIVGEIPADLSVKYIFTWSTPTSTGTKEVVNNLKMANVDIIAPIIPLTSTSHKEIITVSLQIKIGDKGICSPVTKKLNLIQLWINYFRDAAFGSSKDWKVVIRKPIEYSVNATSDCTCDWEISGPTKTWTLKNNMMTTLSNRDLEISPTSIVNIRVGGYDFTGKNSWLGSANGQVKLTCKDSKGNSKIRLLSDQITTNPSAVKIFFDMYKDVYGRNASHNSSTSTDANTRTGGLIFSLIPANMGALYFPPLWYLFWKEGNVIPKLNDLDRFGNPLFVWMADDPTPSAVQGYGAWTKISLSSGTPFEKIILHNQATKPNYGSVFTDKASKRFLLGGTGTHLQCLAETMRHELYHKFVDDIWGGPFTLGTSRVGHSDTDGLPDTEELLGYIADNLPLTYVNNPDTYNIRYSPIKYYVSALQDYSDNELRCLVMERDVSTIPLSATVIYYPSSDWSNSIDNINWTR